MPTPPEQQLTDALVRYYETAPEPETGPGAVVRHLIPLVAEVEPFTRANVEAFLLAFAGRLDAGAEWADVAP